uniref:Uncharacterized protein n=1 Tax=Rhizophora mucronata TaxID=61149 RepID=A0A2P2QYQ4_RHIMU
MQSHNFTVHTHFSQYTLDNWSAKKTFSSSKGKSCHFLKEGKVIFQNLFQHKRGNKYHLMTTSYHH